MIRVIIFIILLISYGNLKSFLSEVNHTDSTSITFLDIGIGDSSLIRSNGMSIFIDGGPEDNILYKLRKYLEVGAVIDLVIISHFHNDHYAGIYELIERYDIREVWLPDVCDSYSRFPFSPSPEVIYRRIGGQLVELLIANGSTLYAVSAYLRDGCFNEKDANLSSIIVVFKEENKRVIFMGDTYAPNEKELIRQFPELFADATVLKAGHHCSDTSSSREFLEYVLPRFVICSTGRDNAYGHPHPEVIRRLEELEIQYYLTYRDGDVSFNF